MMAQLETGEYYHVFNKSISGYRIFNNDSEYRRIISTIQYYQYGDLSCCLSEYIRTKGVAKEGFLRSLKSKVAQLDKLVRIVAFCVMPTHVHFILQQWRDKGISVFMGNVLNSYSRYFNRKHKRLGPLWVGKFKRLLVENDEYMWHLSRYVHLNPATDDLVKVPENWPYSSYREYLNKVGKEERIASWGDVIETTPHEYKKFANDRIDYQKKLKIIKHLMLD